MEEFSPITPRQELNALLNAAIEMALKLLGKYATHAPFAMVVLENGERLNVFADDRETLDVAILTHTLLNELHAKCSRKELRAIAFARNIDYRSAVDGSHVDAIEVDLDHVDERAVTCMLPYTRDDKSQPVPGQLFAIEPRETFFHTKK